MELFLYIFLRELNLNIDMLSSSEAKKKARRSRAIIIARGEWNDAGEEQSDERADRCRIISVKSKRSSEAKRNEVDEIWLV